MYKTCLIQKFAIVIALALPAALKGQVPVISSQKIITEGKVYYMHPVQKGQTLYSISRAYKVTIDDITRTNVIPANGIQTEQVLKIPAPEALIATQPEPKFKPQPKPESQPQSQPQPQSQSQSTSQSQPQSQPVAKTAEKKPVKAAKPETHKVQKGESLSSIARDHGVTERELKKANKGLLFPMTGMYLVIPVKAGEEDDSVNQEK